MTTSPYLSLAERIDADIEGSYHLCRLLPNKKFLPLFQINDEWKGIWWGGCHDQERYEIYFDKRKKHFNLQRIIALLLMHEFYLDELKSKP